MKKILFTLAAAGILVACGSSKTNSKEQAIVAHIDLVNVQNDQVAVSVDPGAFNVDTTIFYMPKTVPGTYEINNYGQFLTQVKALDYDGNSMNIKQLDKNSWQIANAKELDKITYWVNDTYDQEGEGGVFSPAGTNIEAGENFMLNLHAFVGYFQNRKQEVYELRIEHPKKLAASSSLTKQVAQPTEGMTATDIFRVPRYFQVIDHPIMYAAPDTVSFHLQGMEVLLSVYSPSGKVSAKDLAPTIKKMVVAQKQFLGAINNTGKYAILLYLSEMNTPDAAGFGALEHHTSTTVVFPELMPLPSLKKGMVNVVSHEFFHTLTPLNVHSKEIHYFDFNEPKMSKHLWMYEGVTEYFAKLFQVNQGLIDNQKFYDYMLGMIKTSRTRFDDTMPMTLMSKNVYQEKYHKNYGNVYQKGALIGMCLDIRLRELSNGQMGILDLMKKLSDKYGVDQPFDDEVLFDEIVAITYPEIGDFFKTYVAGPTPIPYGKFFAKVGLKKSSELVKTGYILDIKERVPYINVNQENGEIYFMTNVKNNTFLKGLGVQAKDVLVAVNGTEYSMENVRTLIMGSMAWKIGDAISVKVRRDGKEVILEGKLTEPMTTKMTLSEMEIPANDPRVALRKSWLKG